MSFFLIFVRIKTANYVKIKEMSDDRIIKLPDILLLSKTDIGLKLFRIKCRFCNSVIEKLGLA